MPTSQSARVVAIARTWIGTPFRHQGRVKGVGVDCIGLAVGIARELGREVRDELDYGRTPEAARMMRAMSGHLAPVQVPAGARPGDVLEPGDVVLFNWRGSPTHIGVFTGGAFVHAYEVEKRVVEMTATRALRRRVVAAWRLPEAPEGVSALGGA